MSITSVIITTIIIVILWNVVFYFIGKRFRTIARIMQILSFVFVVLSIIFLVMIYMDSRDFMQNFNEGKKTFALVHESEFKSAIFVETETPANANESELIKFTSYYLRNKLDLIQGDSYKLFIITVDAIQDLPEFTVEFNQDTLSKQEAIKILTDDDYAETEYAFANTVNLRAFIFSDILSNHFFGQESQLFFIEEIKKEKIIVYPETIIFKTLKIFPLSWVKNAIGLEQNI